MLSSRYDGNARALSLIREWSKVRYGSGLNCSGSADRQAESDWAESVVANDVSVLERILADDFVGVDIDGSHYSKADAMKDFRTHPSEFASNHLPSQVHPGISLSYAPFDCPFDDCPEKPLRGRKTFH